MKILFLAQILLLVLTVNTKLEGTIVQNSWSISCCWGFGQTAPFVALTLGPVPAISPTPYAKSVNTTHCKTQTLIFPSVYNQLDSIGKLNCTDRAQSFQMKPIMSGNKYNLTSCLIYNSKAFHKKNHQNMSNPVVSLIEKIIILQSCRKLSQVIVQIQWRNTRNFLKTWFLFFLTNQMLKKGVSIESEQFSY